MPEVQDNGEVTEKFDFGIPSRGVNEKDWKLNETDDRNVWLNNMLSDKQKRSYFNSKLRIYEAKGWVQPFKNCENAIRKFCRDN